MSKADNLQEQVADSWEDEALSDSAPEDGQPQGSSVQLDTARPVDPPPKSSATKAPSSTVIAPRTNTPDWNWDSQGSSDFREERRRPEKSTAVAGRLIAGALGVKAPPKTTEQRAYERSIKEQEIRRRNREKEEREKERLQNEKAKDSMWDG